MKTSIGKYENADVEGDPPWELEERTYLFAKAVRAFVKALPRNISNLEDVRQLVRASGSVAANYIEANENLSPKDFRFRAKICRMEAKESRLFLRLVELSPGPAHEEARDRLGQEAGELVRIFSAIFKNAAR